MRHARLWGILGCSLLLALPARAAPNDPPPQGALHAGGPHFAAPHPGGFHLGRPMAGGLSGRGQPPEAPLQSGLGASGPMPGGHFPGAPAGRLVHPAPPAGARPLDVTRWRGGRWWHGRHGGRIGWWWIVGPEFYWYPSDILPYPEPAEGYWYWCDAYQQYYPYVTDCPSGWRPVVPGEPLE